MKVRFFARSLRALACLAIGVGAVGCADTFVLTVRPPADMNAGRPTHVLVRAVEPRDFVDESYLSVAEKVVKEDESVLYSGVVYPGVTLVSRVKKATAKNIAVYFFFTHPGPRWKTLVEQPPPHSVDLALGPSTIDVVKRH
jgi:hypothetical protein